MLKRFAGPVLVTILAAACHPTARTARTALSSQAPPSVAKAPCKCEIDRVLDAFHAAAARADEGAYFEAFAPTGVFLGTDPSERWDVTAFRAYTHPLFSKGTGFQYTPRDRHTSFSQDARTAWFDELLESPKYGGLRGSGVLVKVGDAWKIALYNLTFTVPNNVALKVVPLLKAHPPAE